MALTVVLSSIYMWWARIPHAPFGQRDVRGLLMIRGFGGFFGSLCSYPSFEDTTSANPI